MNVAVAREQISDLIISIEALHPTARIADVASLFLSDTCREFLCLPVTENNIVVGTISRYTVMRIFLQPYGRELFGPRPIEQWINKDALKIDINADIETASSYVRTHITNPITEDFVIVKEGEYRGMGVVLALLELMEKRAKRRNRTLAVVNQNLKSSQTRLIQSEKMASLGQMVAGVAHEINTPLGYVQSNVELARDFSQHIKQALTISHELATALLDGTADDQTLGQLIQETSTHTNSVINDGLLHDLTTLFEDSLHGLGQISELVLSLRNFSRMDHVTISRVSLNECIDNALTIGRNVIKQKADIERNFTEDSEVECVASQINQVLLNVLTNAAQAIPQFGVIKITTRSQANHVDIHIRDNGCGMPESVRKRIFDPFFTTKAIGEGTGLGLSISYQIIQQHKGLIEARSKVDKGTEFVIRLPRLFARGNSAATNHSLSPNPSAHSTQSSQPNLTVV